MKLVFTAIGKKDLSFSNNLRVSGLFTQEITSKDVETAEVF